MNSGRTPRPAAGVRAHAGRSRIQLVKAWLLGAFGRVGGLLGGALILAASAESRASTAFEADIRAFETADQRTAPPSDAVLFLGSSTITRWSDLAASFPGFKVLNRGFGGSQMSDVLHFFDRLVPRYAPALIVLYEGDNDLNGGRTVDQVFAGWTNFVDRVERVLPHTGVLFVSVKPSPSRLQWLAAQQELNRRIAVDCARRSRCDFVDVATPMLDGAGKPRPELFLSDQLHLTAPGYTLWQSILQPHLERWAAAHPERTIRTPAGTLRIDLGSESLTTGSPPDSGSGTIHWNNITPAIGATPSGRLAALRTTEGLATTLAWTTLSRFNGANQNGTTANAPFPASASRDSLFGNTESFSGLANVLPRFRLSGLRTDTPHTLTFYASRMGTSDNRETRFTVTGATTASVDLDPANNLDRTATLGDLRPSPEGHLEISLEPGPRNNNANHFTYLGVLRLAESVPNGRVFLFDLGGAEAPTGPAAPEPTSPWNNLTPARAQDPAGRLDALVATDGTVTAFGLEIRSPFVGADTNGTSASARFPATAARDSLLGVATTHGTPPSSPTEIALVGLPPRYRYTLSLFASSPTALGPAPTRYTLLGSTAAEAVLDTAGNTNAVARFTNLQPDANAALSLRLESGTSDLPSPPPPRLGVIELDWHPLELPPPPSLEAIPTGNGHWRIRVATAIGRSCAVEQSVDLIRWHTLQTLAPPRAGIELEGPVATNTVFFRLRDQP